MAARYIRMLEPGGKIHIPHEIRNRPELSLRKGALLSQSCEENRIILYHSSPAVDKDAPNVERLDDKYSVALNGEYLRQLSMAEGEPLYFSVSGDLIFIEKACCEKCGSQAELLEYISCHFICRPCIAESIRFEKERRK